MPEHQLETALRARIQRRHAESSAKAWALVSDALKEIAETLRSRDVQDVPTLIRLADDASLDIKTRTAVCWILGRAGVRSATDTLVRVAADDAADLRVAAVRALGEVGGRHAFGVLSKAALEDPEPAVRYAAVYSLQWFDDDRSAGVLASVLENRNELSSVRGQAAESLGVLPAAGKRAMPALRAALADPSAEVRFWSVYALGFLGTPDIVGDLHRLTSDTAVVGAFGSVGEEARQAIENIRKLRQP